MIECVRVTYTYPDDRATGRPALRDVSLRIEAGEFVLVTGASGAGKSTWLRCLNGLVPHFTGGRIAGRVTVAGQDVLAVGPDRMSRSVGFVFQTPETQAVLSRVEAEIAFGMENAGIPPAEMRRRMERVLAQLDLIHLRGRRQTTLSGGERQRVALASVLVLEPQIVVLDEPTSQLDPAAAAHFLDLVAALRQELNLTIILAEHRLDRVWHHATRLIHFVDGRPVIDDVPAAAAKRLPAPPPFVALGLALGWSPLPRTMTEARAHVAAGEPPVDVATQPAAEPRSASTAPPLLTATALTVRYPSPARDDAPALDDVSLRLAGGEIVALLGRNGSGKTTLLKCLIGLVDGAGQVTVRGEDLAGQSVAQRARVMAYLPQNPDDLLFADTVRAELRASLRHRGEDGTTAGAAVIERLLAALDLTDVTDRYPRDLSVGQRQRIALAALLVTDPAVILLDEPTRGVGYRGRAAVAALATRWRAAGKAVMIATHDVELAAQLADRAIVLARGTVTHAGPVRAVLSAASEFAPQMGRLFPGRGWLTVEDVIAGWRSGATEKEGTDAKIDEDLHSDG